MTRKQAVNLNVQGFHSVMKMRMDRALISQMRRMPVLGSHNLQMDILNGNDNDLAFEDYLNSKTLNCIGLIIAPMNSTVSLDIHGSMERAMGISHVGL